MTKFPYGGLFSREFDSDAPWTKLATIAEYLEDGERLPPALACWLGEAIKGANEDNTALLTGLGLRDKPGRKAQHIDHEFQIGARVAELLTTGIGRDTAINVVLAEQATSDGDEPLSRTTVQRFHDDYRNYESERQENMRIFD